MTQHTRPAYPPAGSAPEVMGYSIRTDRYRYTEWRSYTTDVSIARELYDHHQDPAETINRIDDPKHQSVIQRHGELMSKMIARTP